MHRKRHNVVRTSVPVVTPEKWNLHLLNIYIYIYIYMFIYIIKYIIIYIYNLFDIAGIEPIVSYGLTQ